MPITDLPGYPGLATRIESFINTISEAQDRYFLDHGKYFQGQDLVEGEPNGIQPSPANTTAKPTDQEDSWKTFDPTVFAATMSLSTNIRIPVYQDENGWGYRIIFEFWNDRAGLAPDENGTMGRHWIKTHHKKPDGTSVTSEWIILIDGPPEG